MLLVPPITFKFHTQRGSDNEQTKMLVASHVYSLVDGANERGPH